MGKKKRKASQSASVLTETLREYERFAIALLASFNETSTPREGFDGSICFPVRGEWRYFDATDDKSEDSLFKFAIIFHQLNDAFALVEELSSSLTYENTMKLAIMAMTVVSVATEVGIVLDKTWLYGETVIAGRVTGGENSAKLNTEEQKAWLKEELKNHKGQKTKYEKISKSLFNKHGYKVGARTVRNRCKEYGLLENA